MKKNLVLLAIAVCMFFLNLTGVQARDTKINPRMSTLFATGVFQDGGFKFISGHWFTECRSFYKTTQEGPMTVSVRADKEGQEVKYISIISPSSQEEIKNAMRLAIRSLAYARGAEEMNLVDVERMFLFSFWPNKALRYWGKNFYQVAFGMYGIAVTMENMGGGKIQIEIQ